MRQPCVEPREAGVGAAVREKSAGKPHDARNIECEEGDIVVRCQTAVLLEHPLQWDIPFIPGRGLSGTFQVGRLVRRPGGLLRQMLKLRVERRRGPEALSFLQAFKLKGEGGPTWTNYLQRPEFLVTPLLMGLFCLIIQSRIEEPVRSCSRRLCLHPACFASLLPKPKIVYVTELQHFQLRKLDFYTTAQIRSELYILCMTKKSEKSLATD